MNAPLARARRALSFIALAAAGCSYDFDSAFQGAPGGAPDSGESGAAGGDASDEQLAMGGSAGSGGTAGLGGGPTGGAGGTGGAENCLNGLDDDSNGLADCEDPACKEGYRCAPLPETGWDLPGYIQQGPRTSPDADCGPSFAHQNRYGAIEGGSLGCACRCQPPTGATCSAQADVFEMLGCSSVSASVTTSCSKCALECRTVRGSVSVGTPGSCTEFAQELGTREVEYALRVQRCVPTTTGVGCAQGFTCVPSPPAAYAESFCIESSGSVTCPSAYPARHLVGVDTKSEDSRYCGAQFCKCGGPTGVSYSGQARFYDMANCEPPPGVEEDLDGQCHTPPGLHKSVQLVCSASGGACAASGSSEELGTLGPAVPSTICCTD